MRMGSLFLKRLWRFLTGRVRGSFFLEGVLVMPLLVVLLLFFVSVYNYFAVSSLIRHRVDGFCVFVASVGSVPLSAGGFELVELTPLVAEGQLLAVLLEGGMLEEERLSLVSSFDGGYISVRVKYRLGVPVVGDLVIWEYYERRLWS